MDNRTYLSPPAVLGEEESSIVAAQRSNWIAPVELEVDAYEDEMAARTRVGHALALSLGTATIHLALLALGVPAGDVVVQRHKIITTSGGGALASNDADLIERCRRLSTQGREPEIHYEHRDIGYNYRMSNILAALGRAQLATLKDRVAARRNLFDTYVEGLGDLDGLDFMPEASIGESNRWLSAATVGPDLFRATHLDIIDALEADNIEAPPYGNQCIPTGVYRITHVRGPGM